MDESTVEEMGPQAIGHCAGEERIVGSRHPAGQAVPRVVVPADGKLGPAQRAGRQNLAGAWMHYVAGLFQIDDLISRYFRVCKAPLAANAGKHGRQTVIVGLAPAFGRMMMTLSALNTNPEKCLCDRFHELGRLPHGAVPGCRRVIMLTAAGRQDFRDELVVGLVCRERVANPAGEQGRSSTLFAGGIAGAAVLQNVGPLEREIAGVFWPFQQAVDLPGPFIAERVGPIRGDFFACRQRAANVDRHAANKRGIVSLG